SPDRARGNHQEQIEATRILRKPVETLEAGEDHGPDATPRPFDLTKVCPHKDYPLIEVGIVEFNRNPENYFAEVERAAFERSNVVPGISFSTKSPPPCRECRSRCNCARSVISRRRTPPMAAA